MVKNLGKRENIRFFHLQGLGYDGECKNLIDIFCKMVWKIRHFNILINVFAFLTPSLILYLTRKHSSFNLIYFIFYFKVIVYI